MITDAQIRKMRDAMTSDYETWLACQVALGNRTSTRLTQLEARARCAEILSARNGGVR